MPTSMSESAQDEARSGADRKLLGVIVAALGLPADTAERVRFAGPDCLPSAFSVTALAAASIGAAALAVAELVATLAESAEVSVDRRLAALWFGMSIRPIGWRLPPVWDPIAGDYLAADGWIRLHTNAPRHRAAALAALDCAADRSAVAEAVGGWSAQALETAVVEADGAAAAMRSARDWADHPQGRAVVAEPLIAFHAGGAASTRWRPRPDRPLAGLKVLDCTRVLAGPAATRFLAGFGADVLRIDPPDWDEPGVAPEVTLGKRCARLDLRDAADRARFERLLADADLFLHGYRPDALETLGLGDDMRRALNPGLIDIGLDAYGWSGPWKGRRGFDSLVQMSTGIAAAGMQWRTAEKPVPLPVQALDHATGYLMAAAAVSGLVARLREGRGVSARLSLARTAALLVGAKGEPPDATALTPTDADYAIAVEATDWGPAHCALPPVAVAGAPMAWERPASQLGSTTAEWPS